MVGKIRVGRKIGNKVPSYPNYVTIEVVMKSHSKWWKLSPFYLKDENGHIIENVWQFSKVYEKVPNIKIPFSKWDSRIIWEYDEEIHCKNGVITDEYFNWREKGFKNEYAVRYPVGYNRRGGVLFSYHNGERLNYVESRIKVYLPLYCDSVKKEELYQELKNMLDKGINLLIIDVDGPHEESKAYYMDKYNVPQNFIEMDSIEIDQTNLNLLIKDVRHPFGHGYCLAALLLNLY